MQGCYHPREFGPVTRAEIHVFSDASQQAIEAAVYLRSFNIKNEVAVSLGFGQTKVGQINPVSILQLELCGAVLAVQAVNKIVQELDMAMSEVVFYTDSKVVLGYIWSESRRFYVYIANRVEIICKISTPDQWKYVKSSNNPANLATRGLQAKDLTELEWLDGPAFLRNVTDDTSILEPVQAIINPGDPEVCKGVKSHVTNVKPQESRTLGEDVFRKFSSWQSLRRAIAVLITKARLFKQRNAVGKAPQHEPNQRLTPRVLSQASKIIIKAAQHKAFKEEFDAIAIITTPNSDGRNGVKARKRTLKKSHLYGLDPYVDDAGILRVGGCLRLPNLSPKEKLPVQEATGPHVGSTEGRSAARQIRSPPPPPLLA